MAKYKLILILVLLLAILTSCKVQDYIKTDNSAEEGQITYTGYGANQSVSGATHIININGFTLMLDAGLFYGDDKDVGKEIPPNIIRKVDAIILSHAHLDHTGRLIQVINNGYNGKIYTSYPTKDILRVMLEMTSKYGGGFGKETVYYSRNSLEKNKGTKKFTPVHVQKDCEYLQKINNSNRAEVNIEREDLDNKGFDVCKKCIEIEVNRVLDKITPVQLYEDIHLTDDISLMFYNTPHLPGSVMTLISDSTSGENILYTGDMGSGLSPFLTEQDKIEEANIVITEGTYGYTDSHNEVESRDEFISYISEKLEQNKRVIIPAFVLDRTQQILYEINRGMNSGAIPKDTAIKVISPSANQLNNMYLNDFTKYTHNAGFTDKFIEDGPFVEDIYESLNRLDKIEYGEIAIASSGMANIGFSKEYVKQYIEDPNTVFIFVGYQDPDSIGGELNSNGKDSIIIDNNEYKVNGEIKRFSCFSGHADYQQIKEFLQDIKGIEQLIITHANKEDFKKLSDHYESDLDDIKVIITESGKTIKLK